jgi:hypothetical protein
MRFAAILRKLALAVAVSGLLCSPADAQPDSRITTTKTASAGKVRAELSYQTATFPNPLGGLRFYQPRLKLLRDGRTVLDEALPAGGKEASLAHIDGPEVRDPEEGGEPEILLKIRADYEHPGSLLIYRYDAATDRYDLSQQADDEKLQVANKLETRRVSTAKKVQAELAFREDIMVEGKVTLKLTRMGKTITQIVVLDRDEEIATVDGPAIIDLEGKGEPQVVLNVFSRGAYCCAYTLIYHYVPARESFARLKHLWGPYRNVAVLDDLDKDGVPEFGSGNENFSGEFGPYAVSGARPIQIWRYRQGRLQDVTRHYPKLIRADAQNWWEAYTQEKSDWYMQQMPLTAYLADMHLLGEGQKGWAQLRQAYQAEDRHEFFRQLRQKLKKHGYAKE